MAAAKREFFCDNMKPSVTPLVECAMLNDASALHREVVLEMASRLDFMTLQPKTILVNGELEKKLMLERYPNAQADIVFQKDHSVDLIFSNLMLPWSLDFQAQFKKWIQLLRPNGLLLFSTLGPDTLKELPYHSLGLIDMHHLGDELIHSNFIDPVLDVENITMIYTDFLKLNQELLKTNIIETELPQLPRNEHNRYDLTYEVIYAHAFAPPLTERMDETGVVKIPLSRIGKSEKKHD